MKKILNIVLVLMMTLTLVQVPTYAAGTTKKDSNVKSSITSQENLTVSLTSDQIHYRENEELSFNVETREDYQLVTDVEMGGLSTVKFQLENDTSKTYTQELNYHPTNGVEYQVQVYGHLEKLGFGENCPVKVISIEIDGIEYQNINSNEGLSFTYSDIAIPEILSVVPDENNKSVYTDTSTDDQYAFYVNFAKPYTDSWLSCTMDVTNEDGDTREIWLTYEEISNTQYKFYLDIYPHDAVKGKYTISELSLNNLNISKDSELYNSLNLSQLAFEIQFGNDDLKAPILENITSNFQSGAIVTPNQKVIYNLTLSNDDDIDLSNSYVSVASPTGDVNDVRLIKTDIPHEYIATLVCDNSVAGGEYHVQRVRLVDINNNEKNYHSDNAMLSELRFTVSNENPIEESLQIVEISDSSDESLYLNEENPTYTITVQLNKEVAATEIRFFNNRYGYSKYYNGVVNGNTVTYTIPYSDDLKSGEYTIDHFYATTGFETIDNYISSDSEQFKNIGFFVTKAGQPVLNNFTFDQNNQQLKPNSQLTFNLDFSSLVSQVQLEFTNKTHDSVYFYINDSQFNSQSGVVEGYTGNKPNGLYKLERINYSINDEDYDIFVEGSIGNALGLNNISFEIIESHEDFEGPKITGVELDESQSTDFTSMEDSFTFYITVDEKLSQVPSFNISNENGIGNLNSYVELVDEELLKYKVTLRADRNTYDGTYLLNNIWLTDLYDNSNDYYRYNDHDEFIDKLFSLTFNVAAGIEEPDEAQIDNVVTEFKDIYSENGEVVVRFNSSIGLENASIHFQNITYNRSEYVEATALNEERTEWEVRLSINESILNGQYRFESLSYNALNGYWDSIYQYDAPQELQDIRFYVECGRAYTKPAKIKSLEADANNKVEYTESGEVIFNLKTSAPIKLENNDGPSSHIQIKMRGYDKYLGAEFVEVGTNQYQIICHIDENDYNGTYYIESIGLTSMDDDGMYYDVFDNEKGTYYLSGLEFKVSCGISDIKPPKIIKIFGDASNKDTYTEEGIYTYYFEFDEELAKYESYINLENEAGDRIYGNFIALGNKTYAVRFNVSKDSTSSNGNYSFCNIRLVDKLYNEAYYDKMNDNYDGVSNIKLFADELSKMQITVDFEREASEHLQILSCTPFKDVVFNEYGQQEVFELKTNKVFTNNYYQFIFHNEDGEDINAFDTNTRQVEDGYITTFSVDVNPGSSTGEYTLYYAMIQTEFDGDMEFPIEDFTTEPVKFVNNIDPVTFSVLNVQFVDLKDGYSSADEKVLIDVTLDKKLDNLSFGMYWDEKEHGAYTNLEFISLEEKNGKFVYHLSMALDEFYGPRTYTLDSFSVYYDEYQVFGCNSGDPEMSDLWEQLGLNDISIKTLYEKKYTDGEIEDKELEIKPLETNKAIYEAEGIQSYIISSKDNFELTGAVISNYSDSIQLSDYTITKLQENEYRLDINITNEMKNDIYHLDSLSFKKDDVLEYFWTGDLDQAMSFVVKCGITDNVPFEVLGISNIVNDGLYTIAVNQNKEVSFVVEYNKPVKDIEASFLRTDDPTEWGWGPDEELLKDTYYSNVEKIDDTHYKISMVIDDVFETGYYHLYLTARDAIGQSVYCNDNGKLEFKVVNDLNQSDSELQIKVDSQTAESGETLGRNEWTNEKVVLNMQVIGDEKVTYKISTDGVNYVDYDPNYIIDSTDKIYIKAVDENNVESNVVVINVRIDVDKPMGEILEPVTSFSLDVQNKGLVYKIVSSDDLSGIKTVEYKLVPQGENESHYPYMVGSEVTVSSNFTGTLYARITDNANNVTITSKEIVAKVHLSVELDGNIKDLLEQDTLHINLTKDENDIIEFVGIKLNGNDYKDITKTYADGYTITENGEYTVLVQTANGGEVEKTIVYRNLGLIDNLLQIQGNTSQQTTEDILNILVKNKDVVKSITIQRDSENPIDITSSYEQGYIIDKNGTYTVVLTTTTGKIFSQSIIYTNIFIPDRTLKFDLDCNNDEYLAEDDVSFLIYPKDAEVTSLTVKKDGVEVADITASYKQGYKITENGTYTFVLVANGETLERTVTYSKIDATQPELTLIGNTDCTDFTDKLVIDVKPDFSGVQFVKIQREGEDAVNITDTYQDGYVISQNGLYTVTLVTVSGKVVSKTIEYTKLTVPYIKLDKTSLRLKPNESYTFVVDTNLTDLEWTSSNTDVVTVENGVVTAVANGSATITVRSGNVEVVCEIFVSDLIYQLGDVNRDGNIWPDDAQLILAHFVGKVVLDEEQLKLADVNQDGNIWPDDAQLILALFVGKL